jgi:hypothetical protein
MHNQHHSAPQRLALVIDTTKLLAVRTMKELSASSTVQGASMRPGSWGMLHDYCYLPSISSFFFASSFICLTVGL